MAERKIVGYRTVATSSDGSYDEQVPIYEGDPGTDAWRQKIWDKTPGTIHDKLTALMKKTAMSDDTSGLGAMGAANWAVKQGLFPKSELSKNGTYMQSFQMMQDDDTSAGHKLAQAGILGAMTYGAAGALGGAGAATESAAGAYGGMDAASVGALDVGAGSAAGGASTAGTTGGLLSGTAATGATEAAPIISNFVPTTAATNTMTGALVGSGTAGAASTGILGSGLSTGVAGLDSVLSNPALIGAGLGAAGSLLGGGNEPAGNVTTTQDIPEWLKGYAKAGMGGLLEAFKTSPGGVNPLTAQGAGYLSDVIGGDYLNNNPYLDAMFNRAAGQVGSRVNSQFTSAGRYGSGAHQGVLGESLGNLATDIYGGNYARERANQQAAALGSGAFGNMLIDQPFRPGQNLLSGVNSIKGGTTTSPYFNNQFGDLLSGSMGGALIGKMFA